MTDPDHLPEVRRLRDEGWGSRRIGAELGIGKDRAIRLLNKLKLEDAQVSIPAVSSRNALDLYHIACRTLAEARTLVEAKDIADRAAALKEYGRLANDRVLEVNAAELRIHAERRLGCMLIETERHPGGRPENTCADKEQVSPSLADLGIDRKLSSRAQKLASISERAMAVRLATWREAAERGAARVTVNLLRDGDKKERRAAREAHLGEMQAAANLRLPDKRYGVILADPPWRFETYSRETGMDRAADNHYPTSSTEDICNLPVSDIAAKDCALFLWATVPMLPQALAVMVAWGFEYKSHCIWRKDRVGTGYWFRNVHELLLVGTRGSIPAPAPGTRELSVTDALVGEHSEKPDIFMEYIEGWYPTLPKIELNARRARPNWDSWGLDAPSHDPITGEVGEAAE